MGDTKVKNKKQGFGEETSVEKVKSAMKECLNELMSKCNNSSAVEYLKWQKNIALKYAKNIKDEIKNPYAVCKDASDYLNKLSESQDISRSMEVLGGKVDGENYDYVNKLLFGDDPRYNLSQQLNKLKN